MATALSITKSLLEGNIVDQNNLQKLHDFVAAVSLKTTAEWQLSRGDSDVQIALSESLGLSRYGVVLTSPVATGTSPEIEFNAETLKILQEAHCSWRFRSDDLQRSTHGKALSCMLLWLYHKARLLDELPICIVAFKKFAEWIEASYQNHPYHNVNHACEVLQAVHMIMWHGGILDSMAQRVHPQNSTAVMLGAVYIAAASHDVGHLGLTNMFLVKTDSPLARRFNEMSCNENLHVNILLRGLRENRLLEDFQSEAALFMRDILIQTILGTDMKRHFQICTDFKTCDMRQIKCPNHSVILLLQIVLKCADLVHTAQPWNFHRDRVQNLQEEMFRQGDKESAMGLERSALADRTRSGVAKAQTKFLETIVLPMYESLRQEFAKISPYVDQLCDNIQTWKGRSQDLPET